jgi:hypothetical protein
MEQDMRTVLIATFGVLLTLVACVDDAFAHRFRVGGNGLFGPSVYCVVKPRPVWTGIGMGYQRIWVTVCY